MITAGLGIIPSFQFSSDPLVNYKINTRLPGADQFVIMPQDVAASRGLGLSLIGLNIPTWAVVVGLGIGAAYFLRGKKGKRKK